MKRALILLLSVAIVITALAACTNSKEAAKEETSPSKTTTTETTTVTTTEDTETTFKENYTSTIYEALKKDSDGSYPYKLATYTSYFDAKNETRTANINASIKKLNNLVIPKGKTFSFNQTVGKRTVLAGYETAKVVQDGEFVDGLGGGVCQVSSTIYECILRANLKIVSRAPHSLEISYVPLGGDATVQWNTTDFQFKNDSSTDIRLKVTAKNGALTCTAYGKKDIDVGNVKISIKKSGKQYVLTRTVNGKVNYTAYSTYQKPKKSS